jgi:hypothetical protein
MKARVQRAFFCAVFLGVSGVQNPRFIQGMCWMGNNARCRVPANGARELEKALSSRLPELLLIFEYAHFLKCFGSSTNKPVQPKRSFRVVHDSCG